jgi:cytochrome c oxidase subunit 2
MLNARALAAAALLPLSANAQNQVNMSTGVSDAGAVITELGVEIFDLHMLIFWICVVIGVGVFGVMLYSIYAHRKSKGVEPAQFHEHTARRDRLDRRAISNLDRNGRSSDLHTS